ncbi:hypothetical protein EDB86DRAFT_3086614 [Lactarius hatsudake]|nr:hypothetical protein EDB86DRAFT_3086614 [Lactarius hatsudake]
MRRSRFHPGAIPKLIRRATQWLSQKRYEYSASSEFRRMQRRIQTPDAPLVFCQEVDSSSLKRQISVLRLGRTETAVDELVDTFYTDIEAWLELANLYMSLYQYTSALQALSHVLPRIRSMFSGLQKSHTLLRTSPWPSGFYLVATDMVGDDEESPPPTGIAERVWYGVELVGILFVRKPYVTA